jgi:hypothetical protein
MRNEDGARKKGLGIPPGNPKRRNLTEVHEKAVQEEVKRLAEKKESLTSARSPARDNYSTRSDE